MGDVHLENNLGLVSQSSIWAMLMGLQYHKDCPLL